MFLTVYYFVESMLDLRQMTLKACCSVDCLRSVVAMVNRTELFSPSGLYFVKLAGFVCFNFVHVFVCLFISVEY